MNKEIKSLIKIWMFFASLLFNTGLTFANDNEITLEEAKSTITGYLDLFYEMQHRAQKMHDYVYQECSVDHYSDKLVEFISEFGLRIETLFPEIDFKELNNDRYAVYENSDQHELIDLTPDGGGDFDFDSIDRCKDLYSTQVYLLHQIKKDLPNLTRKEE